MKSFKVAFGVLAAPLVCAFVQPNGAITNLKSTTTTSLSATTTTLTEETTWKLRFLLQDLPTEKGKKVNDILFNVEAQFQELEGYEPPQGDLVQVDDDSEPTQLKIKSSRWLLSEDPEERKDGLWVWGLFKEPLYPFMLLQLETERVPLPGDDEDAIKPLRLFAQLNHGREKEVGVILKGGDLMIREMETMKADPFGAATVDIANEICVGKLSIEPMV